MLTKLLKFDLKWCYKIVVIFYILTLVFAGLYRFSTAFQNGSAINEFISGFLAGLSIALMINILINSFTRLIGRIIKNVYGDESYLTHTLPVSKKQIFLSKALTGTIVLFTDFLIIAFGLFIMYYSKENMLALESTLNSMSTALNSNVLLLIIGFIFILFLEFLNLTMIAFVSITLAYKKNDKRVFRAFIYGFILFIATTSVSVILVFIAGLWNADIMKIFTSNQIDASIFGLILILAIILYLVYIIGFTFLGSHALSKGVNVD